MSNSMAISSQAVENAAGAETEIGFHQAVDGCMEEAIGEHGLTKGKLDHWLSLLFPAMETLGNAYHTEGLPLLRIPEHTSDISEAEAAIQRLSQGAKVIVFFGTGGSSLGGQTLAQLGGWNIPGEKRKGQERRPRVRFYDNLDPRTLQQSLSRLDLQTTRYVVISKSGNTVETLSQALVALDAVKSAGLETEIPNLFLGLSEPEEPGKTNALRILFEDLGIELLDHHPGIGGRYSCLTNVGLLPAIAMGIDAYAVRQGAKAVIDLMLASESTGAFPPALGAATAIALNKDKDIRVSVMMPYADRLTRFADWYVQLWAESLGKQGEGTCPVSALGPVDQHSRLQMLMDGPRDFQITLVRTACQGTGPRIDPDLAAKAGLDYLAGRHVGDLLAAQQDTIARSLIEAGRPVRTIDIPYLDERVLGALMMHFMLETILASFLVGVDPFDQPAVEIGKNLARQALGHS